MKFFAFLCVLFRCSPIFCMNQADDQNDQVKNKSIQKKLETKDIISYLAGMMFFKGKEFAAAFSCWEQSSNKEKFPLASKRLGDFYFYEIGNHVKVDWEQALKWYKKAQVDMITFKVKMDFKIRYEIARQIYVCESLLERKNAPEIYKHIIQSQRTKESQRNMAPLGTALFWPKD